jgi:hypothetical protein
MPFLDGRIADRTITWPPRSFRAPDGDDLRAVFLVE